MQIGLNEHLQIYGLCRYTSFPV